VGCGQHLQGSANAQTSKVWTALSARNWDWTCRPPICRCGRKLVRALENPQHQITIGMVGKYVDLTESYKSLIEALRHAGIHTETKVNIEYIDSEDIETSGTQGLAHFDAILVPGGFGKRGTEGKIAAICFARENKIPYLGILPRDAARGDSSMRGMSRA